MAFNELGTFGPDQATGVSPIDQLLAASKKKKSIVTQPANVYAAGAKTAAPVSTVSQPIMFAEGGTTAGGGTVTFGGSSDPGRDTSQPLPGEETGGTSQGGGNNGMPQPPPGITPTTHYINNDPNSPYYWQTLGLPDATWAGLPYDIGWYEQDAEGNPTDVWVQQRDMMPTARQLHDLQNIPMPERPDLTDLTETGAYQGIQDLIDLWNNPNIAQEDKDAAIAQFERDMGQAPGWFAQQMRNMFGELSTGIMGQPGMTGEYTDAYNRETGLELQQMQGQYQRMIESMSAQGRNVAGYMKMDEIANSLSSFQMKRDVERLNIDLAMKQAEYDALNSRWKDLFNMGQMSSQQYIDNVNQNRLNALTGYAQQISTVYQNNQLMLAQYSADLQAVQVHSETVYKGIMADMGVSESMMSQMQDYYEMYMAPYYAELDAWAIEQQANQQGAANAMAGISTGISAIGVIAMILMTPLGTSAICIEMMRQGKFPMEWHDIDQQFGLLVRFRRPDVSAGYLRFCEWIIPLMRKSKVLTWLVNIFFQPWVRDMAYLMRRTNKKCRFGRFLNKFGFCLFAKTGKRG